VLTAEEVRAALDGRLTQIARLCFATAADGGRITYGPGWPRGRGIAAWEGTRDDYGWPVAERLKGGKAVRVPGPFGAVGDLFYACEPFWQAASLPSGTPGGGETPLSERWGDLYHYAADGDPPNAHNRHCGPGNSMPNRFQWPNCGASPPLKSNGHPAGIGVTTRRSNGSRDVSGFSEYALFAC
jgi:hypothetical protein